MAPLTIASTKSTPSVILDSSKGIFEIGGNSLPENAIGFYQPVIDWFNAYIVNPNPDTELIFKMSYFNTASSKIIFELIKMQQAIIKAGKTITIHWHYHEEDEDMLEAGQDYEDLSKVPFEFKMVVD